MARLTRLLAVSLGMLLVLTVITGVVYPLVMTGAAQVLFRGNADGSLVDLDGQVVGSTLLGQRFTSRAYFHSRPSATTPPDQPLPTSGSNLGADTLALRREVRRNIAAALRLEGPYNPGLRARDLPVDMVTTSASGVDPDISVANARLQANRVARVRGVPVARVLTLVAKDTDGRGAGFLGEPGVNVLRLDLDVDRAFGEPRR